jgi:arginase
MPLAALLGEGDTRLLGHPATVAPAQVALVGVRSFEPAEAARLARLGVRVYARAEIRERTLAVVLAEALQQIRASATAWGITIDVDAIDPREAPGVNTPVPDGLDSDDLLATLASVATQPMSGLRAQLAGAANGPNPFTALEITEYNPRRDPDGRTARLVEALLRCLLIAPGGH